MEVPASMTAYIAGLLGYVFEAFAMVGTQLSGVSGHVSFATQMASVSTRLHRGLDRGTARSPFAPKFSGSSFATCHKSYRACRHFALILVAVHAKATKAGKTFRDEVV